MCVVRGLVQAVERMGARGHQLLSTAQLTPDQLHAAEARVSRSKVDQMLELALDLTDDPALGLHWGERLTGSTFAPISHLLAHAATLRHAFESLARFSVLLSDASNYEIVELDGKMAVRCWPLPGETPRVERFAAEMTMVGFFRLLRYFDKHAQPTRVGFAYAAPAYHSVYARIFENAASFEQPCTSLVFDRALLDMPAPHRDEGVHEAMQALAAQRLSWINQCTPHALRVRELLIQQGLPHRSDMSTVARQLGMSVRSLRRRLAAEGKSYNDVVNEALATIAKHLLRDKQRTIQETAFEMGFSDTTTFHHAFKRWTGLTPGTYREAQKRATSRV